MILCLNASLSFFYFPINPNIPEGHQRAIMGSMTVEVTIFLIETNDKRRIVLKGVNSRPHSVVTAFVLKKCEVKDEKKNPHDAQIRAILILFGNTVANYVKILLDTCALSDQLMCTGNKFR